MTRPELAQVADPAALLAQLRATSETMPPELRRDLVAAGSAVVPGLVAILEDPELAAEDSPCQGWPPIHAVDLLVEVNAEEAIEPMLTLLREGDLDEILSSRIAVRLPRFGAAALEPLLTELASTTDRDRRLTLCEMLSSLSLRDERVWNAISAAFDGAPVACAGFLARYGDPRGASLIEKALLGFDADPEWALLDLRNLVEAYEALAGSLPGKLAEHVNDLLDQFGVPEQVPIVVAKVGRNDPCPCGSGKKYKRCCLE